MIQKLPPIKFCTPDSSEWANCLTLIIEGFSGYARTLVKKMSPGLIDYDEIEREAQSYIMACIIYLLDHPPKNEIKNFRAYFPSVMSSRCADHFRELKKMRITEFKEDNDAADNEDSITKAEAIYNEEYDDIRDYHDSMKEAKDVPDEINNNRGNFHDRMDAVYEKILRSEKERSELSGTLLECRLQKMPYKEISAITGTTEQRLKNLFQEIKERAKDEFGDIYLEG